MTLSRLIARPLLASSFFFGAANALRDVDGNAEKSTAVTDRVVPLLQKAAPSAPVPTDARTWVKIIAGVQIAGGLGLATGRAPRLSSLALATTLVPATVAGHGVGAEKNDSPQTKRAHLMHTVQNLSIIGGLLIAAMDTEGKPGVTWRTRRAARDARREAGHLASSARLEARLAKAKLT